MGGLFDLTLEQAPGLVEISGFVGDQDDDPVPGITVHMLLEPNLDPVSTSIGDAGGEWTAYVPDGPYMVLITREEGEGAPVERMQIRVDGSRALSVIWTR